MSRTQSGDNSRLETFDDCVTIVRMTLHSSPSSGMLSGKGPTKKNWGYEYGLGGRIISNSRL